LNFVFECVTKQMIDSALLSYIVFPRMYKS
jgi:hypothetical protein